MARAPNKSSWPKGTSGNPTGRPKLPEEVKAGLRDLAATAIDVLREALASDDHRVRVAAAAQVLDRGYGRAAQVIDATVTSMTDPSQAHLEALKALVERKPVAPGDEARAPAVPTLGLALTGRGDDTAH